MSPCILCPVLFGDQIVSAHSYLTCIILQREIILKIMKTAQYDQVAPDPFPQVGAQQRLWGSGPPFPGRLPDRHPPAEAARTRDSGLRDELPESPSHVKCSTSSSGDDGGDDGTAI